MLLVCGVSFDDLLQHHLLCSSSSAPAAYLRRWRNPRPWSTNRQLQDWCGEGLCIAPGNCARPAHARALRRIARMRRLGRPGCGTPPPAHSLSGLGSMYWPPARMHTRATPASLQYLWFAPGAMYVTQPVTWLVGGPRPLEPSAHEIITRTCSIYFTKCNRRPCSDAR